MLNIIRKIFRFFLRIFYPTLHRIEKQHTSLTAIQSNKYECEISNKATLHHPHNLRNVNIKDFSYIAMNSIISYTDIGKFSSIGPNLMCGWGIHPTNGISTSPMFYSTKNQNGYALSKADKIEERKKITIGNDVFIGMNVTILDGVTIGDGAVIGAGSVVSKDIPPYAIAVGSPIQIKKYRFHENTIKKLLEIKWWDFEEHRLKEVEKYFYNIEEFLEKYNE